MTVPSMIEANQYHADRLNDDWGGLSDAEKQAALYRAQDYVQNFYLFKDPVAAAIDPLFYKAVLVLSGEDLVNFSYAQGQQLTYERSKLDGLGETEQRFSEPFTDRFPIVTKLLYPLLRQLGAVSSTVTK